MTKRSSLTEAETAFVQQQRVARLATADEDGTPYLVPICYAYDGVRFYTPLDEKPKSVAGTKLKRVRNIEQRAAATLLVDQYDDDWSRLGYVLVHGGATLVYPGTDGHAYALQLLRERYVQYRTMALERYPVIEIIPQKVKSWGPALELPRQPAPDSQK